MRKIGDKATGTVIQGLLALRLSAFPTGVTRISNRKSGIRIPREPWGINEVQISNRKYFAIFDCAFHRSRHVLIHGSAIKTPRNTSKRNTYEFLIGGEQGVVTPLTLATRHSPLPSGILLSLCWTWDMCESTWM